MEEKKEQERMERLARQLACPEGEKGIETGEMMNGTNIGMTLESIRALLIEDGESILEIGHGNAGHVKNILSVARNISYTGLDISGTMHLEARRLNEAFGNQAGFVLYDGKKLPFEDRLFDKIFTVNTVYFWEEPVAYLDEVHRVLKDNGTFVLAFAQREFMQALPFTAFGFTLYTTVEMEEKVSQSAFKRMKISERQEQVKSKTGTGTQTRNYTILTIKK